MTAAYKIVTTVFTVFTLHQTELLLIFFSAHRARINSLDRNENGHFKCIKCFYGLLCFENS